MALTPVYRIKPKAGDAAPRNELNTAQTVSGGTITLVDRSGAGTDYVWQFASGLASGVMASYSRDTTVAGQGWWMAVTLKVPTYPTVDYTPLVGIGDTTTLANDGHHISQNTPNNLRARVKGTGLTVALGAIGTAEFTYALRVKTNVSGSNEVHDIWKTTAGRSGTAADLTLGGFTVASPVVFDTIVFNAVNSAVIQVKDFAWGVGEPTDAEMASLADNFRGTLDVADTIAPTLSSPTGSATGATTASASVSVSEAATIWCLTLAASASAPDGATIKASGTSQAASAAGVVTFPSRTGLTTGTAYKNYFYAEDAAVNPSAVAASASFTPSAANSPPSFSGSIADFTGTSGAAFSGPTVAGQFTDTDALTYSPSPAGTAWPSGLTINPTTGAFSGASGMAVATTAGLKVRATDTAGQTADSNAFSLTVNAPAVAGSVVWPKGPSGNTLPLGGVNGTARLGFSYRVVIYDADTDTQVLRKTGQLSDGSTGLPQAITNEASLVPGSWYRLDIVSTTDRKVVGSFTFQAV